MSRAMIRTGIGFDTHRFAEGRKLILGGVEIEHGQGLSGHSDADVLTHAVIDALLGAVADGDIGTHFPDSDDTWRDADSIDLLRATCVRLEAVTIVNVDATIVAERPKLAGYIDAMRSRLADAMGLDPGRVSVKATTAETMGALGREEGIAAIAIATVNQPEAA